ncbi:MAG: hypothetical protein ACRDNZ_17480, partial [Streptosporangiaceae bacterium]
MLNRLQQIRWPDLPLKQAGHRWAAYVDSDEDLRLLSGTTLAAPRSSTRRFPLRLMLGGHTAAQAEAWAGQCASWVSTADLAIDVFAVACARLYAGIAREDPQPMEMPLRRSR